MSTTSLAVTDLEVGRRAAAMLNDLQDVLKARLATEIDPEERKFLQSLAEQVPKAALLMGIAVAAQEPDAAIRRGS